MKFKLVKKTLDEENIEKNQEGKSDFKSVDARVGKTVSAGKREGTQTVSAGFDRVGGSSSNPVSSKDRVGGSGNLSSNVPVSSKDRNLSSNPVSSKKVYVFINILLCSNKESPPISKWKQFHQFLSLNIDFLSFSIKSELIWGNVEKGKL